MLCIVFVGITLDAWFLMWPFIFVRSPLLFLYSFTKLRETKVGSLISLVKGVQGVKINLEPDNILGFIRWQRLLNVPRSYS